MTRVITQGDLLQAGKMGISLYPKQQEAGYTSQ